MRHNDNLGRQRGTRKWPFPKMSRRRKALQWQPEQGSKRPSRPRQEAKVWRPCCSPRLPFKWQKAVNTRAIREALTEKMPVSSKWQALGKIVPQPPKAVSNFIPQDKGKTKKDDDKDEDKDETEKAQDFKRLTELLTWYSAAKDVSLKEFPNSLLEKSYQWN